MESTVVLVAAIVCVTVLTQALAERVKKAARAAWLWCAKTFGTVWERRQIPLRVQRERAARRKELVEKYGQGYLRDLDDYLDKNAVLFQDQSPRVVKAPNRPITHTGSCTAGNSKGCPCTRDLNLEDLYANVPNFGSPRDLITALGGGYVNRSGSTSCTDVSPNPAPPDKKTSRQAQLGALSDRVKTDMASFLWH